MNWVFRLLDKKSIDVLRLMYETPWASKHAIAKRYAALYGSGTSQWSHAAKSRFEKIRKHLLAPRLSASKTLLDAMTIRFMAVRLHSTTYKSLKEYALELNKTPYVQEFYVVEGQDYDFLIKIVAPSIEEFERIHHQMLESEKIKDVKTAYTVRWQYYADKHELSFLTDPSAARIPANEMTNFEPPSDRNRGPDFI